ncbi:hypothetical protein K435DRAFT_806568 [Dendrothele bispora CBS 962.96]|uniref:Uncharacterized protein n=1 Tax=Dendrothele bispora (strain CBS 962.96) TaxID=1314807 RepID=A0A4S8L7I6_DENBC|nr:hypothetical protein K435DRAFT_806568 [Dendrothele bispora CBS 962.96]
MLLAVAPSLGFAFSAFCALPQKKSPDSTSSTGVGHSSNPHFPSTELGQYPDPSLLYPSTETCHSFDPLFNRKKELIIHLHTLSTDSLTLSTGASHCPDPPFVLNREKKAILLTHPCTPSTIQQPESLWITWHSRWFSGSIHASAQQDMLSTILLTYPPLPTNRENL